MANQLDRFQAKALKASDVEVVLPPGFEAGGRLTRQQASKVLGNLSDDRDPLGQLQERESNLVQALREKEARRDSELEEVETRLRRHIRGQFPDATKEEQRKLYRFVLRDGERYMEFLDRTDDWFDEHVTDRSVPAMKGRNPRSYPSLWKESENPDLWRKFAREYRQAKRVGSYVAFRLSVVRLLKRRAEVGVLPGETEKTDSLSPAERARLRGIAEDYTDEVEAVLKYLKDRPGPTHSSWPDSVSDLLRSTFDAFPDDPPSERGRKLRARWKRRWERARDLDFPDTVDELKQECEKALELKREKENLLSQQDSQQTN